MGSILLVFIDGIGLGAETSYNPFFETPLSGFARLSGKQAWTDRAIPVEEQCRVFRGIDACLGISGLPQSGTGQATLFTGVNCAEIAGRHYGPFPHTTSIPVLRSKSIFTRLKDKGMKPAFANAYPPVFFEIMGERNRWPVTTRSCIECDTHIRTLEDLKNGIALAADITGQGLRERFDSRIDVITETQAAEQLHRLANNNSFTAFEYFLTDQAGHSMAREKAKTYLSSLDAFLDALIDLTLQNGQTLIVTSDHGNLEDLSIKTHTLNPVPFGAIGSQASAFKGVASLTDIVPAVMNVLSG